MSNYVGDYTAGDTVMIYFNTFDSNDPAASVTMTNFVNTDVHIHKNDDLTQRNNAAGITVDVDVDGIAGCHLIKIDTSDNTVVDFFVPGADYGVRIEGVTVDAGTLNPFVGHFSLENRHVAGRLVATTIATLASQTSFTLTAGSADNDAYNGCTVVVTDIASAVQKCVGIISDYVGATKTVTLAADPGIFTMAASDRIHIFATSALSNVYSVGNTAQTANDNGADINAILTDTGTTLQGEVDAIQAAVITNAAGVDIAADIIALKAETALIVADTNELQVDDTPAAISALDAKIDIIDTNVDQIETAVITNAAGVDVAADIIAVKAETALIVADTNELQTDDYPTSIAALQTDLDTLTDARGEPAQGAPGVSLAPVDKLDFLYKFARNKIVTNSTLIEVYNDAGTVVDHKSTISDDSTDFTRGEFVSGP